MRRVSIYRRLEGVPAEAQVGSYYSVAVSYKTTNKYHLGYLLPSDELVAVAVGNA